MTSSSPQFLLPEAASTVAGQVDRLYYFIHWISLFFFALIVTLMVVFIIRFRRRSESEVTPDISHNTRLEIFWIAVPTLIVIVIFLWGFNVFMNMRIAPGNALTIYVTAQRWAWSFQYPNGTASTNELVVPLGQPVKLTMQSKDLIHSFYVPDFRVKQDIIPNRYTTLWFEATRPGEFAIYCTQYCGTGHSEMRGLVRVLAPEAFQQWLQTGGIDPSKMTMTEYGAALFRSKGCVACHSVDGRLSIGPTLKGVFGRPAHLAGGAQAQVDENYLRESILLPSAKIVAGFANVMPTFEGTLKDKEINALIEYIKSLSAQPASPAPGGPKL